MVSQSKESTVLRLRRIQRRRRTSNCMFISLSVCLVCFVDHISFSIRFVRWHSPASSTHPTPLIVGQSFQPFIPLIFSFPGHNNVKPFQFQFFYSEQCVQNTDIELQLTGTTTNKNSKKLYYSYVLH